MADVAAEPPRPSHPDEGVEVGAVDVDLAAVGVDDVADLADALLEHAVGRRVRHHERGQPVGVLVGLGPEVVDVDVALVVARHDHHPHARHDGRGGVGPVGGRGDEAHVALLVTAADVVAADGEQPCQLALRPGVGLERDGVVAGDLGERGLEVVDEGQVALDLVERGERVDVAELGPRHRLHLGGAVELHRARAERDHRPVEGDVHVGELPEVAQHLGLGAVFVEHRVGEVVAGAALGRGQAGAGLDAAGEGHPGGRRERHLVVADAEHALDPPDDGVGRGLVQRDADRVAVDAPEVDPVGLRPGHEVGGLAGHAHGERCRTRCRWRGRTRPHAGRRRATSSARAPDRRSIAGRRGRGTRRTSTPSRPAAPGRCRCWRSPSRAGCAARGSAERAGARGGRRRRPRRRRAGRAAPGGTRRGWRGTRRGARRSPWARRSAATTRPRRRPPARPGGRAGCRRAGRWPRPPARRRRAAPR